MRRAIIRLLLRSVGAEFTDVDCPTCEGCGDVVHDIDCDQCADDGGLEHAVECPSCRGAAVVDAVVWVVSHD